ncbi:hypothetical protein [Acanthopleuribacter pedis]|uniref:Uncharacterized protein n=1 Tax=Acanthopleuribacter pedis TaxID=442870 RepID=A0A8J7QII4_9BACT|nr:hypothetical protein [Acanthopleuribacter pedis]MBO1318938.1 hypothetical protein [Acanthopleuribacter pedis]
MDHHQKLLNRVANREASHADPDAARGFSHSSAFESLALFQEQLVNVIQGYGQSKHSYVPPKLFRVEPDMAPHELEALFWQLKGNSQRFNEFHEALARNNQMGITTYNAMVALAFSAEQVMSEQLAQRIWRSRRIILVKDMIPVYEDFKRSFLAIDEALDVVIRANCLFDEPDPFAQALTKEDVCILGNYLNHLDQMWKRLFADLEEVFHQILPNSALG